MWNIELYLGPLYPTSRLLQHIIISTLLSLPPALYKGRIYPRLYTLLGSGGIFPFPAKSHMVCVLCIISLKWFPSLATRSLAACRLGQENFICNLHRPMHWFHHPGNYHRNPKTAEAHKSLLNPMTDDVANFTEITLPGFHDVLSITKKQNTVASKWADGHVP